MDYKNVKSVQELKALKSDWYDQREQAANLATEAEKRFAVVNKDFNENVALIETRIKEIETEQGS